MTQVATWPAQNDDVRDALRWLVDHAKELRIDPERIGVMGHSAGGHLSLMLGTRPTERKESLRVRCVVNFFGPTELRDIPAIEHARSTVEALVGGRLEEKGDALSDASPLVHVDRTDAPVLTFHGTKDPLVPVKQAHLLHAALKRAQVPNRFVPMDGVGHGVGGDVDANRELMRKFLSVHLKGTELPLVASEDFDKGAERWQPTDASAWRAIWKEGRTWYALTKKRSDYTPKVRSPLNISLLRDVEVGDFVLDVDLRSTEKPYGHQSLCLFFGHQDPTHFYYVHLGRKADAHANSIFLVNDKPRVSIAMERTDGTDWSRGWHRVRIRREVQSGRIEVWFDDMSKPIMSTVDKTFTTGRVGIGSFDDTGDFDAVRLWGRKVGK